MEEVTFKSKSRHKINLLIQVAKEMGIKADKEYEVTDEDMAVPGGKFTKKQVDDWLAKDDGESIPAEEAFAMVREELVKYRKKKNAGNH
jgi:hypothetical protein